MTNQLDDNQKPDMDFSMEIDGRIYTVHGFLKHDGETLQEKIERMIQREMLSSEAAYA